jgi:polysaccharide export outer membrane protein
MKLIRTLLLLAFPFYLLSCTPQQRIPYYLENVADSSGRGEVLVTELRIQKNDILSIQIYSASTKPEADELFNLQTAGAGGTGSNLSGFLVDAKGNIEYPRLGIFHAEGLTKDELAAQIKKRLTEPVELLSNPSVIIRFQNLRILVMGEVANQGPVIMPGERVTVLEAIGLAGGITEFGQMNAVKIIREANGKREFGVVDLSSDSLFQSPYFNLMQNDMVLVQPSKRKEKKAGQEVTSQRISLGLTIITTLALLYNLFR